MRWLVVLFIAGCSVDDLSSPDREPDQVQRCARAASIGAGVFDVEQFEKCMHGDVVAADSHDAGTRD